MHAYNQQILIVVLLLEKQIKSGSPSFSGHEGVKCLSNCSRSSSSSSESETKMMKRKQSCPFAMGYSWRATVGPLFACKLHWLLLWSCDAKCLMLGFGFASQSLLHDRHHLLWVSSWEADEDGSSAGPRVIPSLSGAGDHEGKFFLQAFLEGWEQRVKKTKKEKRSNAFRSEISLTHSSHIKSDLKHIISRMFPSSSSTSCSSSTSSSSLTVPASCLSTLPFPQLFHFLLVLISSTKDKEGM